MRSFDEAVRELEGVLREIKTFASKMGERRWHVGKLCFEIFGQGNTAPNGQKIADFAAARGCARNTIGVPLVVYRSLGAWYEKQSEYIPFSIACRSVAHDPNDADRIMRIWLERGKPDEAEWQKWLDSVRTLSAAQNEPLPDDPDEADKKLRREARKKFKRFRRRLKAAAEARFFENRYLKPDEAKELLGYLGPLMGKRSNLLKIAKPKQDQGHSGSGTAETHTETEHVAPAAELIGAGVD